MTDIEMTEERLRSANTICFDEDEYRKEPEKVEQRLDVVCDVPLNNVTH